MDIEEAIKIITKRIDDELKRKGFNFTSDIIENRSFWEVEELLSIGHYKLSGDKYRYGDW